MKRIRHSRTITTTSDGVVPARDAIAFHRAPVMNFHHSFRTAATRGRRALVATTVAGIGAAMLVAPSAPASAAGVGDNFSSPRIIARSTGVDQLTDTTSFTAEAGEPKHGDAVATRSAWFKWQSPATGRVTFRTQGSDFDTVMSAYTGDSLATLTSIGEDDDTTFNDGSIRQSQLHFDATAGVTYRIAVDAFGTGFGKVRLSWDANDSFSGATQLSGPGAGQTGVIDTDNTGATKQAGEPQHAGLAGGQSVWFSWKAPATGTAEFGTARGKVDTLLAAYKGSAVDSLTKVAANDDAEPGLGVSAISFTAVKGTTYHIAIDGKRPLDPTSSVSPDEGPIVMGYSLTPATAPSLSVADLSVPEGNSGLKQANVLVKLSTPAAGNVTVSATTLDGTAKKATDFVNRKATVVIPKGSTSAAFPVQVVGDTAAEPQEKFSVSLSAATGGATIGDSSANVTITDNDAPQAVRTRCCRDRGQHRDEERHDHPEGIEGFGSADVGAPRHGQRYGEERHRLHRRQQPGDRLSRRRDHPDHHYSGDRGPQRGELRDLPGDADQPHRRSRRRRRDRGGDDHRQRRHLSSRPLVRAARVAIARGAR